MKHFRRAINRVSRVGASDRGVAEVLGLLHEGELPGMDERVVEALEEVVQQRRRVRAPCGKGGRDAPPPYILRFNCFKKGPVCQGLF